MTESALASVVPGRDGITFNNEALANEVLASAIVGTQGPSVSLHRACTLPLSTPTLSKASNGVEGGVNPPDTGCGLSGEAV
jgi:hypothetical protein